jgi:hypothetical protein
METYIRKFVNEKNFSDISLKIEDEKFNAHKVVLSSRSEFFKFQNSFKKTSNE